MHLATNARLDAPVCTCVHVCVRVSVTNRLSGRRFVVNQSVNCISGSPDSPAGETRMHEDALAVGICFYYKICKWRTRNAAGVLVRGPCLSFSIPSYKGTVINWIVKDRSNSSSLENFEITLSPSTRFDQKVPGILIVSRNVRLYVNTNVVPFKVIFIGYITLMLVSILEHRFSVFPILETLLKYTLWYRLQFVQRFWFIFYMAAKRWPSVILFIFGKRNNHSIMFREYGDWSITTMLFFFLQNFTNAWN